uniref:Uncharacterized protein n=1 Tax=Timspurckia oligopyrenoides TaxID=708627 RepID=A0A7S0ZI68_9RHOD|mmetsp:Transcript_6316/g.11264  ORF Transcript_6316/g.11264 Transcript_6316/m.11264 type:complete len:669 (+) Transcript_6316:48-2054(+)
MFITSAFGFGISIAPANRINSFNDSFQYLPTRTQRYHSCIQLSSSKTTHSSTQTNFNALNESSIPPRFYTFEPSNIEYINFSCIQLTSESLADYILDAIKSNPSEFATLANQLSQCEFTKDSHGHFGWIPNPVITLSSQFTIDSPSPQCPQHIIHSIPSDLLQNAFQTRPLSVTKFYSESNHSWYVFLVNDALHKLHFETFSKGSTSKLGTDLRFEQNSYVIETMGCQANSSDSERMASALENAGFHAAKDPKSAHIVVLNTCAIREHAEHKVYGHLGVHAIRKQRDSRVLLVVSGCVAQQEGETLLRKVPELDIIAGPQYANRLGELVKHVEENGVQICATNPIHVSEDLSNPVRTSKVTAWVNVIYGCNERCTYCVVPSTRGLEQSRSMVSIRNEIVKAAESGVKEIVLLGQNIDAYGRDLTPKNTFTQLLEYIHDVEGIKRIRFLTSHPRYMSSRLIDACAKLEKVCEHFHVPFQSGSDEILQKMSRGYTAQRYLQIIQNIRDKMPHAGISGDAIVGFPEESEEQFESTLDLMRSVGFDLVNTAAYSPRPNTPAALMKNQVPEEIKQERLKRINMLVKQQAAERSARYLGLIEEVLVESMNPKNENQVCGRTQGNRIVFFDGKLSELFGTLVQVRITQTHAFYLMGEVVTNQNSSIVNMNQSEHI